MSSMTSLPWSIWRGVDGSLNISNHADEFVCVVGCEVPGADDVERMNADADFILRVCNAHPSVVSILRTLYASSSLSDEHRALVATALLKVGD